MKPEINLKLEGNTLTILEGNALEQKHPEKIKVIGDIFSVREFVNKRLLDGRSGGGLQRIDKDLAIVVVDKEKMNIHLFLDKQNVFGTEVVGQMEFTPELLQFGINTTKQFNREELVKLFRFNRRFISCDFDGLLAAYQKLQIQTASQLQQDSDTRGNRGLNFQKTVNSQNIPTEFILNMPIFKGFPKLSFRVEICLDTTDASVRFWFESVELHEIIETKKDEIIDGQLESCQDFVIIYK